MSTSENLPPSVMRIVVRELKKLAKNPPFGVRFLPRDDDIYSEIYAELHGPAETPFAGGRFVVKLVIDSRFPSSPPRGYFVTKIFHPNVSTAGEICVNALKKDWKPNMGLSHVLKVIWCLLLVPFPESSLNAEAGKLFMESYDDYSKKAAMMTRIYAIEKRAATHALSSSSSTSSSSSSPSSSKELPSNESTTAPSSLKSKSPNRPPRATMGKKRRTSSTSKKAGSPAPTHKKMRKAACSSGNRNGNGGGDNPARTSGSSKLRLAPKSSASSSPFSAGENAMSLKKANIQGSPMKRTPNKHRTLASLKSRGKKSHRRKSLQRL